VHEEHSPIGVVLAGGAGRRLGGEKARVPLLGTPLLCYPIAALRAVLPEVVVVAKRDTELPPLPGVPVWSEPDEPRHPLTGIVHALEHAGKRPVLVCAGDLPFVTSELVRMIAQADGDGAPAFVPRADGRLQPLLARYEPAAVLALAAALADAPGALTDIVAGLRPRVLDVPDGQPFFNVNVPEDLLTAGALLERRETS
jgi:molybdenum cofactor guanylyltransferase